ncbi:MAG: RluA family pseudouridine synthase [Phycisphaerales bacterium]
MLSVTPSPDITFKLHHEDDDLIVIEKPSRVVTQPGKGHESDTLLNGLFARFGKQLQNVGGDRDFGLLHRLDRSTSGLLVVALRARAYDGLRRQFEGREVRKYYWAVCAKPPREQSGVVNKPILESTPRTGEDKTARISSAGKQSVTAYRVLAHATRAGQAVVIEARPLTGRLHQVRVHLDAIGATVLGDNIYGSKALMYGAPRLALHAHRLVFVHPISGAPVDVRSAFPKDLRATLRHFGLPRPDLDEQGRQTGAGSKVGKVDHDDGDE